MDTKRPIEPIHLDQSSNMIKVEVTLKRPLSEELAQYDRRKKYSILRENAVKLKEGLLEWIKKKGLWAEVSQIGEPTVFNMLSVTCTPRVAEQLVRAPGVVSVFPSFEVDLTRPVDKTPPIKIEKEKRMATKTMIIFPYSGYDATTPERVERERVFWRVVEECKAIDPKPVVVLNRDTEIGGKAAKFLQDPKTDGVEIKRAWSVDTCQMWLDGWGYIIDQYPEATRIVQLPGDIDTLVDPPDFYSSLGGLILATDSDIVIGDFRTGERYSAKELIDIYGTYPLLASWFPKISEIIRKIPLLKPRSEFLNIKVSTLKDLLSNFQKCF
ncbi:hypothetical protein HYR99_12815 [Candidatus Poribacteria bacterium]|nr:hypothetical protein [Candidatus Poribacteria bacterium]